MPSFTFVSTANAFVLRGAMPVFVDIRTDTLNIDETLIEAAITPRTKAICVVHYAGVSCEMDTIMALAMHHGLIVIEDAAQAISSTYKGRPLGSIGQLGALSFHETKNVISGEGGALLVNDESYAARAEIIREKGTNRSKFFRGQVDKYTWVDVGSSYLPSEILAAVLTAQLEGAAAIQAARGAIWDRYHRELAAWATRAEVARPFLPDGADHPAHLYWLRVADLDVRTRLLAHLRDRGIGATFHYQPLHLSEVGRAAGGRPGDCPVTEAAADTLVRLPLYTDLTAAEVDRVLDAVTSFTP